MKLPCLLAVTAWAAAGACVELSKDAIEAADLGLPALRADHTVIGFTPAPGAVRRISAGGVARLLKRAGVSAEGIEGVCVVRGSKVVRREEVVAALRKAVGDPAVSIELVAYPATAVPEGTIEFPRAGLVRRGGAQPDQWRGRVRYGPGRSLPFWAEVHLALERSSVVAARDLKAGDQIQASDVRTETLRLHPFVSERLANANEVVLGVVQRSIRAGTLIERAWLKPPFEVNGGDVVKVEVTAGMAALALEATAEGRGRTGETIWVRNTGNGRRIRVRLTGKGTAVPAS